MLGAPVKWLARGLVPLVLAFGTGLHAQEATPQAPVAAAEQFPSLMIDRNRLLAETLFGKTVEAEFEAASKALIAENLRLEAALEEEERELTDRRASLPPEEFQALAAEFDRKTEEIRAAQDAKSRFITTEREEKRQRFLQAVFPVMGDLMRESGAVAIFDKDLVILALRGADITDEAIQRVDAVLGDGSGLATAPAPQEGGAGTVTGTP